MPQLPTTRPADDPAGLWRLQNELLEEVQRLLGPRDLCKTIYQPVFRDSGPQLRNTPTLDGAFAELSRNGESYWPTVLYEMAHETVHLLDPTVGCTNWLEEGIAVEFSIYAQAYYEIPGIITPSWDNYVDALQLVRSLPHDVFSFARRAREISFSLNNVSIDDLLVIAPDADRALLTRLAERCEPR